MQLRLLQLLALVAVGLFLVGSECSVSEGRERTILREFASDHPNVEWRADGSQIVFSSNAAVYTYVLNALQPMRVMKNIDSDNESWATFDFAPAISPDGERIVLATHRHRPSFLAQIRGHRQRSLEISIVDLDGSDYQRLTDNRWLDAWPVYSPDGQQIAFLSDRGKAMTWPSM